MKVAVVERWPINNLQARLRLVVKDLELLVRLDSEDDFGPDIGCAESSWNSRYLVRPMNVHDSRRRTRRR